MSDPVQMITTSSQLETLLRKCAGNSRIAVDTEGNGFHRYPEQLCLLQFATEDALAIIDPLSVDQLAPLEVLLGDPRIEKVMHGADYDIRSLDREWGFRVRNLYDTGIAARFCGLERLGLGSVMEEVMGRKLAKEKRLQRADWSIRPLTSEALNYAADDVRYLLELRDELGRRLETLGRIDWVVEECERLSNVRYVRPDSETAFLAVRGSGKLDGVGLAAFRRLFSFRESEARKNRRPPFRILSDKTLLHIAEHPNDSLDDAPGIGSYGIHRYGGGIKRALAQGLADDPYHRPKQPRERVSGDEEKRRQDRIKELKAWRSSEGALLKLDPPLLWPTASLDRLSRAPETIDQEIASQEVREWQRQQSGRNLRVLVADRFLC